MKIALAQINPIIGDFAGNTEKIVRTALNARSQGAELTIFSELCVTGYPPRDLLEKPSFLDAQDRALDRMKKALSGIPVIIGYVGRRFDGQGNLAYNSAALVVDGEFLTVCRKVLLPTYDVFDEERYFEPGEKPTMIDFLGWKFGLSICEDIWNDKDFWKHRLYARDPIEELANAGAQAIINISASPYCLEKQAVKEAMLSSLARKHRIPLVYVNQVGGNDDLIFDGRSMVFSPSGKLVTRAGAFEEGVTMVNLIQVENDQGREQGNRLSDDEELRSALVMGLRDYTKKCGFKGAVLGLSGGIDSALVATLAAEALGPSNVVGVAMPSRFNAAESLDDARALADNLGIEFHVIPIEKPFSTLKEILNPVFAGRPEDTTEENMQARIRGLYLMALSNKFGHLLLTTGNKSELATGYCTLYGDMCGGLAVISDLYKTTVYRLSNFINESAKVRNEKPPIPERTITRSPSAELRPNQTDQDSLPPYDMLDAILKAIIEDHRGFDQVCAMGFDAPTVKRVFKLVDYSEYKRRQAAPGLKVTAKAFGTGRRIPVAQRFRDGE